MLDFGVVGVQTLDSMHLFGCGIIKKILLLITDYSQKEYPSVDASSKLNKEQCERVQNYLYMANSTIQIYGSIPFGSEI